MRKHWYRVQVATRDEFAVPACRKHSITDESTHHCSKDMETPTVVNAGVDICHTTSGS